MLKTVSGVQVPQILKQLDSYKAGALLMLQSLGPLLSWLDLQGGADELACTTGLEFTDNLIRDLDAALGAA